MASKKRMNLWKGTYDSNGFALLWLSSLLLSADLFLGFSFDFFFFLFLSFFLLELSADRT